MLSPQRAPDRDPSSLARELRALAAVHGLGVFAGLVLVNSVLGVDVAWRWAATAAAVLVAQWIYLLRQVGTTGAIRGGRSLGLANWVTLLRGLLLAAAAGWVWPPRPLGALGWAPMGLFTAAICLDLLDGYLARRHGGPTRLGERLELGLDSLAMLVGSALAVVYRVLPWWYLSYGLASPAFQFGLWLRRRRGWAVRELPDSSIRRWIAGTSMGFLSATLWPVVSPSLAAWVGLLFLLPFLASFARDWGAVGGWLDPTGAAYRRPLVWVKGSVRARWPGRLQVRHLVWLVGPALIWLVMRNISLADLAAALRQLAAVEILALGLVNLLVVVSFSARWWAVLWSLGRRLPYGRLVGYRLAAFAVSYFTPGPHFGGEPLQAYLLHRREAVPIAPASASVLLERTIEMLVNFAALSLGVAAIARLGLVPPATLGWLGAAAGALLALPLGVLAAAWAGARPLSTAIGWLPASWTAGPRGRAALAAVVQAEAEMTEFCRRRPAGVLWSLGLSIVSWGLLLAEYWLALRFLGLSAGALQTLAAVGAARLAMLLPFPGALGALEASQVLVLSELGYAPAHGAALALLIRARDLAFGAVGLLLGMRLLRSPADNAVPAGTGPG